MSSFTDREKVLMHYSGDGCLFKSSRELAIGMTQNSLFKKITHCVISRGEDRDLIALLICMCKLGVSKLPCLSSLLAEIHLYLY